MKRWARHFDQCITCGTTERPHLAKGSCGQCYDKARRPLRYRVYKWAKQWPECVNCGGTKSKHKALGLCEACYTFHLRHGGSARRLKDRLVAVLPSFASAIAASTKLRNRQTVVLIDRIPSGAYTLKTRTANHWNYEGTDPRDLLSPLTRVRLHEMRGKVLAALFIATSFLTPNDPDRGLMFISNLRPPVTERPATAQPVTAQHVPGDFLEGIVEVALR